MIPGSSAFKRQHYTSDFYQAWPIMQISQKFIFEEKEDWLQRLTIYTDSDLGGYFNC